MRSVGKISAKQRQFVEDLFHRGAATKQKLSAEQIAQKMKDHFVNGNFYFTPEEYLQTTQIRGLIARIKKKTSDKSREIDWTMSEDDGIESNVDEIVHSVLHSDDEDFEGFDGFDDNTK